MPELASEARTRLRLGKGVYRREHVRAFAQHAEIADHAIYIKVSKKHPIEDAGSHPKEGSRLESAFPVFTKVAEGMGLKDNLLHI